MKRMEIIVSGFVQGVGFRYHVNIKALRHKVTGFVRNLDNGDVLLEAQGEEPDLYAFIEDLPKGLIYARIDEVKSQEIEVIPDEVKFKVKY